MSVLSVRPENKTIRQIAYAVASALKQEADTTFLQEVVFHAYNIRAKLIRERVEKYSISMDICQTVDVPLRKASVEEIALFNCGPANCEYLMSYVRMPTTIRNSDNLIYTSVNLLTGESVEQVTPESYYYLQHSRYTGSRPKYALINGFLVIFTAKNRLLKFVRVKDVFEFPHLLSGPEFGFANCENCGIGLEEVFPLPADLVDTLIDMLVVKFGQVQKIGQEQRIIIEPNTTS
jgi:hypothetical protein